ncbi:MAG: ribonuclease III domain-containing protein [Eubacterium sp.]|nr:ribonuclease III domain-containing protein [Eubacterium sp.]
MNKSSIKQMNTTALAYMGDAVYEVYVRKHVMQQGAVYVDKLHKMGVNYVKAANQAKAIKGIFDSLTLEEQSLVKRAKNRKVITKAKNADIFDYKWATAFEALIGYLYLCDEHQRMEEIILKGMEIIDE